MSNKRIGLAVATVALAVALTWRSLGPGAATADAPIVTGPNPWSVLAATEAPDNEVTLQADLAADAPIKLTFGEPTVVVEPAWTPGSEATGETWSVLKVPVCQPSINNREYGYQGVRLFIRGEEIKVDQFGQTFDYYLVDRGGQNRLARCDVVSVPVAADADLSAFRLQLETMVANDGPEVPNCAVAQDSLKARGVDIAFDCQSAGQTFGFEVASAPAGMSDSEATRLVHETLFPTIHGTWVFEGGVTR